MANSITFSPRASLAVIGICMKQMKIWDIIGNELESGENDVN